MKIENVKIKKDLEQEELIKFVCAKNNIDYKTIKSYKILKKSVDARDKNDVHYIYSFEILTNKSKMKNTESTNESAKNQYKEKNKHKYKNQNKNVVIVGAGPAGLFCALELIENGMKPIVIEQGKCVEERQKDIEEFLEKGKLNPLSNVQFGEGGAGTFSDGKLTTSLHNEFCVNVLETFVKFGAPEEIKYINKPHIGTDNLVNIIKNIRNYIIENGGEIKFEEKVVDFIIENNKILGVICRDNTNKEEKVLSDAVVLAIGHSARDTFEKLYEKDVQMEKKNFSVGVRIEHKQEMLNKAQYRRKNKIKITTSRLQVSIPWRKQRLLYILYVPRWCGYGFFK